MNYANQADIKDIVRRALKEDIGKKDITTEAVIPAQEFARAILLAKEDCVVCGLGIVSLVFKLKDKNIRFRPLAREGDFVKKGKIIARVWGNVRSILTCERVALNFLSFLSGISTRTRKFVNAIKPYKARIMDTRKTLPGLRLLEKYAVRIGGGFNHRMNLDEMVLIKDNHIKIINSKAQIPNSKFQTANLKHIIGRIKKSISKSIKVEVEVKNLQEFKEALEAKPDIIMLDNMKISDIRKAVMIRRNTQYAIRNTLLEASGRITLKNVKMVASTGVDAISVGALTHSPTSVDISLEIL